MRVHGITIFADNSFTPNFDSLSGLEDIVLRLHSGSSVSTTPGLTIFFADLQKATNFKNAIIQSWETFLRENEEKL